MTISTSPSSTSAATPGRRCTSTWGSVDKTASTLSALTPEHLPALVVAPKRVAENTWPDEAELWRPELSVALASGTPAARDTALRAGADLTIIGRDNVSHAAAGKGPWRTLILDESTSFKTRNTARWRAARKLAARTEHVWELTGTPSPNGLLDLWAQLYLLDSGVRLYPTLGEYRSRFFTPGRRLPSGVVTEWRLQPGAAPRIHRRIEDICLSMTSDGRVELPPVTINPVPVPLPSAARKVYDTLKRDLVVDLTDFGVLGEIHTAETAAVLTVRLQQITAGFLYSDEGSDSWDPLHTEKLDAVREIVEGTGGPVLVFYRFRAEFEALCRMFPQAETIDSPGFVRRWNSGEIPLLLAHPASAGHGLNLQYGGHTAVWTTLPWSLEEWDQANKRLARPGQEHPVVIHVLHSPNTVDGAVRSALDGKATIQQALLDHLESLV